MIKDDTKMFGNNDIFIDGVKVETGKRKLTKGAITNEINHVKNSEYCFDAGYDESLIEEINTDAEKSDMVKFKYFLFDYIYSIFHQQMSTLM